MEQGNDTYEEEFRWPISRWREFYQQNPGIAFMLVDQAHGGECLGGISLLPLREGIATRLSSGALKETELRGEDLFPPERVSKCRHWHIGGVVLFSAVGRPTGLGRPRLAKEMISQTVRLWLNGLSNPFPMTLTAEAYSEMGGSLLRKFGFNKVQEHPDAHGTRPIYRATLSNSKQLSERMAPLIRTADTGACVRSGSTLSAVQAEVNRPPSRIADLHLQQCPQPRSTIMERNKIRNRVHFLCSQLSTFNLQLALAEP